MIATPKVILASASPRRHELLTQLGVAFEALDADIDERRLENEEPAAYAERLAREKAHAGWRMAGRDLPALGADTIVVVDGQMLLKPESPADAVQMLRTLSGRRHTVFSAVAVARDGERISSSLNRTEVSFAPIPAPWIERYAASGDPLDKAGGYAVQGEAARWIEHIDGSFSGVMGLPLFETARLLEKADLLA